MSSRNMNFSNRAQKAKLTTLSTTSVLAHSPVAVEVTPLDSPWAPLFLPPSHPRAHACPLQPRTTTSLPPLPPSPTPSTPARPPSLKTHPASPPCRACSPQVTPLDSGDSEKGSVLVTWASPGAATAAVGTDGGEYWGYEQLNTDVVDYYVSYSTDGGATWVAGPSSCGGSAMSCTIDELPAGTTTLVKVQAGSSAGWGESSEVSYAATLESGASRDCASMLQKQVVVPPPHRRARASFCRLLFPPAPCPPSLTPSCFAPLAGRGRLRGRGHDHRRRLRRSRHPHHHRRRALLPQAPLAAAAAARRHQGRRAGLLGAAATIGHCAAENENLWRPRREPSCNTSHHHVDRSCAWATRRPRR